MTKGSFKNCIIKNKLCNQEIVGGGRGGDPVRNIETGKLKELERNWRLAGF